MILVNHDSRAVCVTQPGRAPVQIGPFPTQKVAEEWVATLTAHAPTAGPDVTVDLGYHDPEQPHIDPAEVPSTMGDLIEALPRAGEQEEVFPGLYHLLACKVGTDRATLCWNLASKAAHTLNAARHYEAAADSGSADAEHDAAVYLRTSTEDLLGLLRNHPL